MISTADPSRRSVHASGDTMRRLSDALWAERELLERLVFKLHEEQLLLDAGQRWAVRGRDEIDQVLGSLDRAAVERGERLLAAAAGLGVPVAAGFGTVIDAAPFPWDTILNEHRQAIAGSVHEILDAVERDSRLVREGRSALVRRVGWIMPLSTTG